MKRVSFGLQYNVSGLTDGSVKVTIKNSTRSFFDETVSTDNYASAEKVFTFNDRHSAWLYADNYAENVDLTVSWARGVGITENLGTTSVMVKRNKMNVVNIQLGANDGSASIGITTEDDSSMDSENLEFSLID